MLNLASILGEGLRIEQDAEAIFKGVVKEFATRYRGNVGSPKPKHKFVLLNPEKIDKTDVLRRMAEYSSWSSYYNACATRYRTIMEYLENLHESLTKSYIVNSVVEKSDRKRECAAKAKYAPILRASQLAKAKFQHYIGRQELASQQYTLCSRIITYQGDAMRVG